MPCLCRSMHPTHGKKCFRLSRQSKLKLVTIHRCPQHQTMKGSRQRQARSGQPHLNSRFSWFLLLWLCLCLWPSIRNPWKSCWNALSMSINAPCSSNKMCALKKYWKALTTLFSGNVFISRPFMSLCPLIVARQMCIIISTHFMWEKMLSRCDYSAKRAILCTWTLSRTHIMKWWKIWRKT